MLRRLERLDHGTLELYDRDGTHRFGNSAGGGLAVQIEVRDPRLYRAVALGGSLGAAEAYLDGWWTTPNLTAALRLFARNAAALSALDGWASRLAPLGWLRRRLARNSLSGSRRNIAAHYDLSNELFALMLDETMTYSCGIFEHEGATLAEASRAKYDRICRKLELQPGDHVVEIGSGWGGFALFAAENYGCRVTTTTISRRQFEYAQERIERRGLAGRITLLDRDYRRLEGTFDKLVSIEMIEAVGHEYLPVFFGKCAALLTPEGAMALQAITIPDQRYDRYRRSTDFIQRYVFPGGCLPSLGAIHQAVGRAADLRLTHLEDFSPHYAKTLAAWRERFHNAEDEIRRLGGTDTFLRCWEYYLCYCEAGFAERLIGVAQMLFEKPLCRLSAAPCPGDVAPAAEGGAR